MIKNIISTLFLALSLFLNSCSNNDKNKPVMENEEISDDSEKEKEELPIIGTWIESEGILVMESENTKSDLNKWIFNDEIDGFSGTGHLRFNEVNNNGKKNETSGLKYTFKIKTPGNYILKIKASRNPDEEIRSDESNDLFIKMEGDFDGVTAEAIGGATDPKEYIPADKKYLLQDKKYSTQFGGTATKIWRWSTRMSIAHHEFRAPWYGFKADKEYTLTLTGRSKDFVIDRIVFYKYGTVTSKWEDAKESKRE